jgi:hypothetical protein
MVFSPIFNRGFGKFFVNSPSLVAYPAAITIFFITLNFNSQLNKASTVVGTDPEDFKGLLILRKLLQITTGKLFLYILLMSRVYQGDTSTLETGATEPAAIDTRQ